MSRWARVQWAGPAWRLVVAGKRPALGRAVRQGQFAGPARASLARSFGGPEVRKENDMTAVLLLMGVALGVGLREALLREWKRAY